MKEKIIELLRSTKRAGMDKLIEHMEQNGFFDTPCSTRYHLAKDGGLAEHSYNVYCVMKDLSFLLQMDAEPMSKETADSLIICALLHDLGKMGQFGKPVYIPKMCKGRATKANPDPEPYRSTTQPFESNPELLSVDHEIRSIQIASQFIELTEEESWAILMHNGLYGAFKYQIPGKETPLYLLLHTADMWASRVLEKEVQGDE